LNASLSVNAYRLYDCFPPAIDDFEEQFQHTIPSIINDLKEQSQHASPSVIDDLEEQYQHNIQPVRPIDDFEEQESQHTVAPCLLEGTSTSLTSVTGSKQKGMANFLTISLIVVVL
jgi:hypothetical protein